jgi:hypothetical protein
VCVPLKGYRWSESFKAPISFDQWVLCERFQLGTILTNIYLNGDVLETAHRNAQPGCYESFEFMVSSQDRIEYLLEEAEDTDLSGIKLHYFEAFSRFYPTLFGKREDLPYGPHHLVKAPAGYCGPTLPGMPKEFMPLDTSPEAMAGLKESFEEFFESYFTSPLGRSLLQEHLLQAEKDDIFAKLKKTSEHLLSHRYELFAKFLHNEIRPIEDMATPLIESMGEDLKAEIKARIKVIAPLCDLDPAKRPPFEEVSGNLLATMFLV